MDATASSTPGEDPVQKFKKLPLVERVLHKHWKVREAACRELTDKFSAASEDAKIYSDFFPALGKIVRDSNAPAQLVGFNALSKFADTAPPNLVRKAAGDVVKGIAEKGLAGRLQNKMNAVETFLTFVGADAGDVAVAAMATAGFSHRTPKVVAAAIDAVSQALNAFGKRYVPLKVVAEKLPPLFGHSQEIVRNAAKGLAIEMHRWVGDDAKVVTKGAKEVTLKELDAAFAKHAGQGKPEPTRLTRSMRKRVREGDGDVDDDDEDDGFGLGEPESEEPEAELEINLIEKLAKVKVLIEEGVTKDWYTAVDSKKWKARKTAMDEAVAIVGQAKLTPVNHQDVITRLRKIIAKDTNVNVVASAASLLQAMCNGLRKNFPAGAAKALTLDLFGRLKEKNRIMVDSVTGALDALHLKKCIRIVELQEEIAAVASHKTPKARCEALLWLGRSLRQGTAGADLKGAPLKSFGGLFVKRTDDSSPEVRDAALGGLASLQKLVGEKNMTIYLEKLDKKRRDKVAAIATELPDVRKVVSSEPEKQTRAKGSTSASASQMLPATSVVKQKHIASNTSSTSPKKRPSPSRRAVPPKQPKPAPYESDDEGEILRSPESALDLAVERFEEFEKANWSSKSFKARAACMAMVNDSLVVKDSFTEEDVSFALGLLSCAPGLGDTNFMALKPKLELFRMVATRCPIPLPRKTLRPLLLQTAEKFGDIKSSKVVGEIMMSYAEVTSPRYLFEILAQTVTETKNNRAVIAILKFLGRLVEDFGIPVVPEQVVATVTAASLGNPAPAARNAALTLACRTSIRMKPEAFRKRLLDHNTTEEGLELFDAELQKYGQEPDPPTRKKKFGNNDVQSKSSGELEVIVISPPRTKGDVLPEEAARALESSTSEVPTPEPAPPRERVSLSEEFAPGSRLFLDLKNSNWKKRQDALAAVDRIINSGNDFIKPDIGMEIINALRARLSDSNRNLAVAAYNVLSRLILAMGTPGVVHFKVFAPTVLSQGCVDIKRGIRDAATKVVRSWFELFGLEALVPYCHLPLASLNSCFRKEFLEWLIPCLQGEIGSFDAGREDLSPLIDSCFACLRDRTTEVRHLADLMLEQVVRSVGIGAIDMKLLSMTKAARNQIDPVLEKYRASAPKAVGTSALPPEQSGIPVTPRSARERPRSMALPRTPASRRGGPFAGDFSTPAGTSSRRQRPASARASPVVPPLREFEQQERDETPVIVQNDGRDVRAQRFLKKRRRFIQELNEADPSGDMQPLISEDVEDLMEDLTNCCSPYLCTKLTAPSNRFRMHVEAIEVVSSYLDIHPESLSYAADVLLRWSACRIEDSRTPPTVLVKLAVFVSNICEVLMSSGTTIGEYEACAILPPIVDKCGSNRESIREAMRSCLLSIGDVVSDEVFLVLLTSCLRYPVSPRAHNAVGNEICRLIEKRCTSGAGMPAGVLPTIGKVAGSEDEGAGRAAAVCLDRAHEFFGDDLWELVGGLTETEAGLLEGRLKAVPGGSKEEVQTPKTDEISGVADEPTDGVSHAQKNVVQRPTSIVPSDIRSEDFRLSVAPAPPNSVITSISGSRNTATPRKTYNQSADSVPATPGLPMKQRRIVEDSENENLVADILARLQSHDRDLQLSGLASIFDDLRREGNLLTYTGSSALLLQLVKCFTETLGRLENGAAEEDDPAVLKSFLKGVIRFAREPELLRKLDQFSVESLLADALNAMLPQAVVGVEDWDQVRRGVNLMIVKVLESCNQNLLYTAMINLLLENIKEMQQHSGSARMSPSLAKSSICIKSIAKVTKRGFADCRMDALLRDIHLFLVANPVRRDGKPSAEDQTFAMRLLKTVVNAIIDAIGKDIRSHLSLIPHAEGSQLVHYIDMTLGGRDESLESSEAAQQLGLVGDRKDSGAVITWCLSNIEKGIRSDSVLRQLQNELEGSGFIALDAHLAQYDQDMQVFVRNGLDRLSREESQRDIVSRPDKGASQQAFDNGYTDASLPIRRSIPGAMEDMEMPSGGDFSGHSAGQVYLKRLQEIQLRYGLQTGDRTQMNGVAGTEKENGTVERVPSVEDTRDKASTLRERMARIRQLQSSSKD